MGPNPGAKAGLIASDRNGLSGRAVIYLTETSDFDLNLDA